jgi:hypothetical protein
MRIKGLNPERAHVGVVLRTAVEVFAFRRGTARNEEKQLEPTDYSG